MSFALGMVGKAWIMGLLVTAGAVGWALDVPSDTGPAATMTSDEPATTGSSDMALLGVADARDRLGDDPGAGDVLAAVQILLDARAEVRGHDTAPAIRGLDAASLALDAATGAGSDQARAHRLHLAAAQGQLVRLDSGTAPGAGTMGFTDPLAAVLALAAAHGVDASAIDPLALEALRTLDPSLQGALSAVLASFLAYQTADQAVEKQSDLAHVIAARTDLVLAAEQLAAVVETVGARDGMAPLQVAHVLSIDVGPGANTYNDDFLLLIDVGGDDTYHNNAGGSGVGEPRCSLTSGRSAAALIDLGGNDRYIGDKDCGANGGGHHGAGLLYDNQGDDTYRAGDMATNGGALLQGTGMILDVRGHDVYQAGDRGTNGGADAQGLGLIVDATGNDAYSGGDRASNGGGLFEGVGAVIDGAGDDSYLALGHATNGGAADEGYGMLVDLGGSDDYAAAGEGANGGATDLGVGLLVDVAGADEYLGSQLGSNGGGARGGIGLLIDYVGNDRYSSGRDGVNGGAFAGGFGMLFDAAGDDRYMADVSGVNGGATAGDVTSGDPEQELCPVHLACFTPAAAWGLLMDLGGTDVFEEVEADASGTDRSVFPKGMVGAQLDFVPELDDPL